MLQAARTHKVGPALAWCLRGDKRLPSDTRSYLDALLRLNGKRNERLLLVTERIVAALNEIGIEPVLLKGVAHLATGLYPAMGVRLVADLDVLIPKDQSKSAFTAMEQLGFVISQAMPEDHHHLAVLRHDEFHAVLELHTRIEHMPDEPIIPVAWFREHTQPIHFRGSRVRGADATASIAHNVHHSQLNHQYYSWKQVEFRQLLDLAMIRAHQERDIDWAEIDRRFGGVNHGHVLATYLKYAETFFGQPIPKLSSAPRQKAIARLRRGLAAPLLEHRHELAYARQGRRGRWARIALALLIMTKLYVRARWKDPRGLIKLLNPLTWTRQFKVITRLFEF